MFEKLEINSDMPVPESYEVKEVYAFFGLTAYTAQVLEHAILNLAVVLRLPSINLLSIKEFDRLNENLGKETFGQLLLKIKRLIGFPENKLSILYESLTSRNYITHHFFKKHAEDMISESGRKEIIDELSSIIYLFKRADDIIVELYNPLRKKYGVTEDFIKNEYDKMYKRAAYRDGAD